MPVVMRVLALLFAFSGVVTTVIYIFVSLCVLLVDPIFFKVLYVNLLEMKTLYLLCYNLGCVLGWGYVLKILAVSLTAGKSPMQFWQVRLNLDSTYTTNKRMNEQTCIHSDDRRRHRQADRQRQTETDIDRQILCKPPQIWIILRQQRWPKIYLQTGCRRSAAGRPDCCRP